MCRPAVDGGRSDTSTAAKGPGGPPGPFAYLCDLARPRRGGQSCGITATGAVEWCTTAWVTGPMCAPPTQTGCDGRRPPGPLPGRRRPGGGPRRRSRPGPARRPRARPTTMVRDMGYPLEGCMISLVAGPGSEEGPLVPLKNRPPHVACQAPRGRRRTKKGRDHGSRGRMESGSVTVSSRRRLPPARPGFRPCPGAHSRCCPSAWPSTRCRP